MALPTEPTYVWPVGAETSVMDTSMPSVDGTTLTATTCGEITTHLATLKALDGNLTHKLIVTSSLTCNLASSLVLPLRTGTNPNGTGWIIFETSSVASLPAEGTRVIPASHSSFMPKLNGPAGTHTMYMIRRAHHYRFIGIEFGMAAATLNGPLIALGTSAGDYITSAADYPHHIVIDRCYVHGQPTITLRRGIGIEGNTIGVVDSHISDCHEAGSDSQAIAGWNFQGPLKIVNNYLEGAGENFIIGGNPHVVSGVHPSDIEVRRNYFFKPVSWRGSSWTIKNSFELKHARRVIVEGNVMQNCWFAAQRGYHILLTPRHESDVPSPMVDDVTIRYNRLISSSGGFSIIGRDSEDVYFNTGLSDETNRVWIHNNLLEDVSSTNWGADGRLFSFLYGPHDLRIDHNTAFAGGTASSTAAIGEDPANYIAACPTCDAPYINDNVVVQDNILSKGTSGVFGSAKAEGKASINYYSSGGTFTNNDIIGATLANYPVNNFNTALGSILFNNQSGLFCTDCGLQAGSPLKGQATDLGDIGIANWTTFITKTCGAITGDWTCAASGDPAPTVSNTIPATGTTVGGTSVTITGTGFLANPTVAFGGTAATNVVQVSSITITCDTPAHAAGTVNVVVTNTDAQFGTQTNGFTFQTPALPPTVTGVSPSTGSASGTTPVTITGTQFAAGATVLFDASSATSVVVVNPTTITCITPVHADGAVNVTVTNTDALSGVLTNGYTYSTTIFTNRRRAGHTLSAGKFV